MEAQNVPSGKERQLVLMERFLKSDKWRVCLLYGPPGVGKTFLLKQLENQITAKGEYEWKYYYGYGNDVERMLNELTDTDTEKRLIIIDEIDGVSHYNPVLFEQVTARLKQLPKEYKVILTTNKAERMTPTVLKLPQVCVEVRKPNLARRKEYIRKSFASSAPRLLLKEAIVAELGLISENFDYAQMGTAWREGQYTPLRRAQKNKLRKFRDDRNRQLWTVVPLAQNDPTAEYSTLDQVHPQDLRKQDFDFTSDDVVQAFRSIRPMSDKSFVELTQLLRTMELLLE